MSWQASAPALVLASGSASRRALLEAAGISFTVCPAGVDEAAIKRAAQAEGLEAGEAALRLAEAKAAAVALEQPEALVIGCDQLLVCEGRWFDKPVDIGEARTQLRALRGREHVLATAVCCRHGAETPWREVARPRMRMRDFSDGFLDSYLQREGGIATAMVGAYRLEGPGVQLFEAVEGEHAAVLGLPLLGLAAFLRRYGVLAS